MAKYLECRDCDAFCWIPGCLALGGKPCSDMIKPAGEPCVDHEPRETPLLVDVLAEALQAVYGQPEEQFRYLEARNLNPPKTKYGHVMCREDCEWMGDYETDARHTSSNRARLRDAVIKVALARYQEEVGDA